MSDIFKDMQAKTGCEYISNLPSHKRVIWKELKKQNLYRLLSNSRKDVKNEYERITCMYGKRTS